MAEPKHRYRVVVGFDYGRRRANVGDVVDWLDSELGERMKDSGIVEEVEA